MFAGPFHRQPSQCEEANRAEKRRECEILVKMSLLLPPPTPCSNSRDYSKDDDSDSDVSEDSAGKIQSLQRHFIPQPLPCHRVHVGIN